MTALHESITVVTATGFEARAARSELGPDVRIVRAGVALARLRSTAFSTPVISCGLAGGTTRYASAGTVLVPAELCAPTGERLLVDRTLMRVLLAGARALGLSPVTDPLYTSATIVRGCERERLAAEGFAGVDMESALIVAPRLAVVRVILDTPQRELSGAWTSPLRAALSPAAWRELPWLMRDAGRFARLAARVVAAALRIEGEGPG